MKHQVIIEKILKLWSSSNSILLTGAANLDGDALGCLLALYDLAVAQGKEVVIVNEKPLSSLYSFLGVADRVLTVVPKKEYDAIFICDTGSFDMLGTVYSENADVFAKTQIVNIDHHTSCYGDFCWSTCSFENTSATMMVAKLIEIGCGPQAITKDMATYLLLGLYYDTECFRNANTSAEGYKFAARMMEFGADHNRLIRNLYQSTAPAYVGLYGEVLASLVSVQEGIGMIGVVTQEMLKRRNISIDCLGNELVNDYLRSVQAKFVILLKETVEGGYRISLRSKDDAYDMRPLAAKFGGGGHKLASGACTKHYSLEEVMNIIANHVFDMDISST